MLLEAQMATLRQRLAEKDRKIQAQSQLHTEQLAAQAHNFNCYRPPRCPQRTHHQYNPHRSPSPRYARVHSPKPSTSTDRHNPTMPISGPRVLIVTFPAIMLRHVERESAHNGTRKS